MLGLKFENFMKIVMVLIGFYWVLLRNSPSFSLGLFGLKGFFKSPH